MNKKEAEILKNAENNRDLEIYNQAQKKIIKKGKILFWLFTILGFFVGVTAFLVGMLQVSQTAGEIVAVAGKNNILELLILCVGIALFVDCYLLIKGFEFSRIVYSVLMAIYALWVLGVLMTGEIDLKDMPELAIFLLIVAVILIIACTVMSTDKAIKEYMYDREIKSIEVDKLNFK